MVTRGADNDGGGLRTLERGLAILEVLGGAEEGLPLSDFARRLGLAGKAILAHLPPDEVDGLLRRGPLAAWTPATIVDPATLRLVLDAAREQGYAQDREEGTTDVACVAAPLFGYTDRPIAALSGAGPVERVAPSTAEPAEAVMATAPAISRRFGYRPRGELSLAELGA